MASSVTRPGKTALQSLSEQLNCPVCLDVNKTPRMLACLHSFCEACISDYIAETVGEGSDTSTTGNVKCPVCERTTPSPVPHRSPSDWAQKLPLNYAILAMLETDVLGTNKEGPKLCDICLGRDKAMVARAFCTDCSQFQCQECMEKHAHITATASHDVIGLEEASAAQSVRFDLGYAEYCHEHQRKKIKYYCEDHAALCCSSCTIANHRKCQEVVELKQAYHSVKKSDKADKMKSRMKNIHDRLETVTQILTTNVAEIEPQAECIVQKVTEARKQVLQIFDDLLHQVSSKCDKLKEEQTTEIGSKISGHRRLMAAISSAYVLLESVVKNGSETQIFIALHRLEEQLHYYDQAMTSNGDSVTTVELHLDIDKVVKDLLQCTKPLANVSVTRSKRELENQSDFEPPTPIADCRVEKLPLVKVQKRGDLKQPNYTGAGYLPDGRLVAADRNNSLFCLLDDTYGVVAEVALPSKPSDLAVIGPTEVAVVLPAIKQIQIVTIDTIPTLSRLIPCSDRSPWCVASAGEGEFVVGWDVGFSLLAMDGKELKHTANDYGGNVIRPEEGSRIAMDLSQSRVYVSFYADNSVNCYGWDGRLYFTYRDGLNKPYGQALDRDGNLYISSYHTGEVHQLAPAGTRISTIHAGMSYPCTLCFNAAGDELLVFKNHTFRVLKIRFVPKV